MRIRRLETSILVRKRSYFNVDEQEKYRLTLDSYTNGDAGDPLRVQSGQKFPTKDQDNDIYYESCAQMLNSRSSLFLQIFRN